jgi:ABC-2 type transport system permease protein
MGIRKLATLVGKELLHGPRGFILVMVIAAPLLITLVINLALGNLFSGIPQLAVYSEGDTQFVNILEKYPQIEIRLYPSMDSLKDAVNRGAADMGIVLPAGMDSDIANGQKSTVTLYMWGESLAKDRLVVISTVMQAARDFTSQAEPIILETVTLGDKVTVPWSQRLMPLTVMMAVFFGGLMMPAVSLINEKQKRTLQALVTTPTSIINVLLAKGIVGALLSLVMGIIILLLNQAWGNAPAYLLVVLMIAASMASILGLILGTTIKDINTLFAVWKFGGALLFGPAIIYMFPSLPQWIGYIFPTYYIVRPIMDISLGTITSTTLLLTLIALACTTMLAVLEIRLASRFTGERLGTNTKLAEA